MVNAVREGVALTVDDTPRLGEIDAPTLILWGERDAVLGREEQEWRAAAIPKADAQGVSRDGPRVGLGAAGVGCAGPGGIHERYASHLVLCHRLPRELRRILLLRPSEKGQRGLQLSPADH